MNNRYFLMRHGESEANKNDLIISDPKTGCQRYGLTERGKEQARESAEQSKLGKETLIFASDFTRARETAEIAREVLGCEQISHLPGLRERFFGELEGDSGDQYKDVWALDSADPHNTVFGVESPLKLVERLNEVIDRLEREHSGETILLVSHGDPLRFLQVAQAKRPLTEHLQIEHFTPAEIRPLDLLPEKR